jgi:putative ABC transport system substrate-binding protein
MDADPFPTYQGRRPLMTLAASWLDLNRRAVDYVDRIFRGANPADLPIQLPARLELTLSLRAAKEIGLTLPRSLLLRADRVIE